MLLFELLFVYDINIISRHNRQILPHQICGCALRDYFKNGKSMSWFQHKMSGIDGNGGTGGFTQDEAEQLRNALFDLSDRIRRAADNIEAPVAFKPI